MSHTCGSFGNPTFEFCLDCDQVIDCIKKSKEPNSMIEEHFQKKRTEYMANPDDSKLEELQFIQTERRIQHPERFIKITRDETKKRMP